MITAPASKYVSASSAASRTTVDQPQAASVPTETSVSIVAAPWRALTKAARWKGQPAQRTTGVARAKATHSQPANWSGSTIATRAERHAQDGRDDEAHPQGSRVVAWDHRVRALRRRPVARSGDRRDEVVDRDDLRIEGDRSRVGGVVDRRLDAVEPVEPALDPGRARGAVMPSRSSRMRFVGEVAGMGALSGGCLHDTPSGYTNNGSLRRR